MRASGAAPQDVIGSASDSNFESGGSTVEKWVVDKNFLESPELAEFLSTDPSHRAVLIDFSAIEGYTGNPVKNMHKSLAIVSQYPDQVLVLKGAGEIVAMGAIDPNTRFDLVDWNQTRGFAKFCRQLERAKAGDPKYVAAIAELAQAAQEHLAMMETKMAFMVDAFEEIGRMVGPEALRARREKTKLPIEAGEKIITLICHLADSLFANDPAVPKIKGTLAEARHYYTLRYATAGVVLAVLWAQAGGASGARTDRLRNDFVDLSYVTAATYFDGLFTNDKRMSDVYAETVFLIEDFFSGNMSRGNAKLSGTR